MLQRDEKCGTTVLILLDYGIGGIGNVDMPYIFIGAYIIISVLVCYFYSETIADAYPDAGDPSEYFTYPQTSLARSSCSSS